MKQIKQGVISRGLKPAAFVDPDAWRSASPDEKRSFVNALNKKMNDARAAKALPPLPKRSKGG